MVEKRKLFLYSFFFKNCTSLGPNCSILLGSWKGQIEKKFQSRIHRGQFRFWRGRNDICPTRLAFGVNLALFILQCTRVRCKREKVSENLSCYDVTLFSDNSDLRGGFQTNFVRLLG